ncbi:MAG TPA: hypothetical protein VFR60_00455 [Sphingomicrobium sp.]|nr:hypothetical protein [Sphingomicrobium sp.]
MDFSPGEGQRAVADVVNSVLGREDSWEALVSGGVTALAVPERLGGDGVGLPQVATALTEIGRHGTISPALATLGLGLLPLLDAASNRTASWPGAGRGGVLTTAPCEPGSSWLRVESRHEARRGSCRPHQGGVVYASSVSEVAQISEVANLGTVMLDTFARCQQKVTS